MSESDSVETQASMPERLKASAARIKSLNDQLAAEYSRRDHLIVSMCDDGYPQSAVARHASVSLSTINRILAKPIGLFPVQETQQRA